MMTLAQFRARFTALTSAVVGDVVMQAFLDEAALEIGEAYGDFENSAHGYLAAHLAVVDLQDQASAGKVDPGIVTSLSVPGAMSVSLHAAGVEAKMRDPYLATTYGQRFCAIRDREGKGAVSGGGTLAEFAQYLNW